MINKLEKKKNKVRLHKLLHKFKVTFGLLESFLSCEIVDHFIWFLVL